MPKHSQRTRKALEAAIEVDTIIEYLTALSIGALAGALVSGFIHVFLEPLFAGS